MNAVNRQILLVTADNPASVIRVVLPLLFFVIKRDKSKPVIIPSSDH